MPRTDPAPNAPASLAPLERGIPGHADRRLVNQHLGDHGPELEPLRGNAQRWTQTNKKHNYQQLPHLEPGEKEKGGGYVLQKSVPSPPRS